MSSEPIELTAIEEERVQRILSVAEECVQESELRKLIKVRGDKEIIAYDGFEPSGRMHIAQGLQKALNVNKLTKSGVKFVFWVADYFAMLNLKQGGKLDRIQTIGKYMIEVWKACGMDMDNVEFRWASEEITAHGDQYWTMVFDIASKNTVTRIKRCAQIMGRLEGDDLSASQIMYPCMQAADIFYLKADICQLGLDQRKVNVLAREYADATKRKKPIILSHHMLSGLKAGQEKMSKSSPESAIFMEDTEQDVNRKIKKAFCPEKEIKGNPIMDYLKHIVFPCFHAISEETSEEKPFIVKRKEENGGNVEYMDYKSLEADYLEEKLHPGDLKPATALAINELLEPVRIKFKEPSNKALLKKIKGFQKQKK